MKFQLGHKIRLGSHASDETRAKMSQSHTGLITSVATRAKISVAQRGRVLPETTRAASLRAHIGSHHSDETRAKMSLSHKGLLSGPLSPNWKGGVTTENHRVRNSPEYRLWHMNVLAQNGFVCSKCGDNEGGNLIVHHMDCFADFPEKRMDISNGIAFCDECHREFHRRYGTLHNRKWQTDEFVCVVPEND